MKVVLKKFLLLVAVCILLLPACTGKTNDTEIEHPIDGNTSYEWGKVTGETITIWGDTDDLARPYNMREFERYQELTGNKLEIVSLSKAEYAKKVPIMFSPEGGESPDILLSYGGTGITALNPDENFYDFIDAPWLEDLTDTALNPAIYNGKVMGLPHGEVSISGMLYNKQIFRKHNLQVPQTQEQFLQVCETLLEKGITPVYLPYDEITMLLYQFPMDSFLQNDQLLKGLNDGSVSYDQIPEMRQIVEWYKTMEERGYFGEDYEKNNWSGMDSALKSESYAMMICWDTWLYTNYTGDASQIGLMPAFMGTPEQGCFEGANMLLFMVNNNSPQREAALDFINYLADPINYNLAYEGICTAPIYKNQVGSFTTPQYVETERLIEKLYNPSTAWLRVKGFSQMDASFIQTYMQGGYTSVEECLKAMDASRRKRAGLER